jgi:hypothetical protein
MGTGSGSVGLSFSGGTEYQVGQLYSMDVTITDPNQIRFGFSMVARDADNNLVDVGTWSILQGSVDTQVNGPGSTHVGHRQAPFAGGTYTFKVNWTAPATGVGDVTFYLAANAADGDGQGNPDAGDNVYLKTLTISEPVAGNMPPVLTVPGGTTEVTNGFLSGIAGISVADPDAGSGDLTVKLTVGNGIIQIDDSISGGVGAGDLVANGSAIVTMTGTLAELNAVFNHPQGVSYKSNASFLGLETLDLEVDDLGNTGGGGSMLDSAAISINVNQGPSLSAPTPLGDGSFQVTLNGVSGLTYDVEYADSALTWTLLEKVTMVSSTALVTDGDVQNVPARIYRVVPSLP